MTQRLKNQNEIRIVLILACNENADVEGLMSIFVKYFEQNQNQTSVMVRRELDGCRGFPAFQIIPGAYKSSIKNRIFVIGSQRDPKQLIDLAKCADIVCPVVSVLSADPQKIV